MHIVKSFVLHFTLRFLNVVLIARWWSVKTKTCSCSWIETHGCVGRKTRGLLLCDIFSADHLKNERGLARMDKRGATVFWWGNLSVWNHLEDLDVS